MEPDAVTLLLEDWGIHPDGTLEPDARIRRAKVRTLSRGAPIQRINAPAFGNYDLPDTTLAWAPGPKANTPTFCLTFSLTNSSVINSSLSRSELFLADDTDTLFGMLAERYAIEKPARVASVRPFALISIPIPITTLRAHKWAVVHLPTGLRWDAPAAPAH